MEHELQHSEEQLLLEHLGEHQLALENLAAIEQSLSQYSAEGISAETAHYLKHAVNAAVNPIGLSYAVSASFESFEGSERRFATNLAMEGIKEVAEKVIEKIKAIVKALMQRMGDIFEHIKKRMLNIDGRYESLVKKILEIPKSKWGAVENYPVDQAEKYVRLLAPYNTESSGFIEGLRAAVDVHGNLTDITQDIGTKILALFSNPPANAIGYESQAKVIVQGAKRAIEHAVTARNTTESSSHGQVKVLESNQTFLGHRIMVRTMEIGHLETNYYQFTKEFRLRLVRAYERSKVERPRELVDLMRGMQEVLKLVDVYRKRVAEMDSQLLKKIQRLGAFEKPPSHTDHQVFVDMLVTVDFVSSLINFHTAITALISSAIHAALRVGEGLVKEVESHTEPVAA